MDHHRLSILVMCAMVVGTAVTDVAALRAVRGVERDTATAYTETGRMCPPGTNVTGSTTASGDADRLVKPDVGRVSFSISVTRNTSSDARLAGNRALTETVTALLDLPYIIESDIETNQFSLLPNYEYDEPAGHVLTNWTFTQGFSTTVRRVAEEDNRVGQVIDIATDTNDNVLQVKDIEFYLSKNASREIMDELRVEAVQTAMKTAAVLITATGATVGGVTQISDSSYIPYQSVVMGSSSASSDGVYPYSDAGGFTQVPTTVHEGTIVMSSTTSVTVEICM